MDSKRRGRMKRRIAALCVLLLVGFVSRYWLWRSVPILPYGLLPILRFDPQLRCASREEVLKRLGEPYYEEGRYSYVPAKEERAGVIFNYDASNRISHVNFCFSTGLYGPAEPIVFDPSKWQSSPARVQSAMSADLIVKCEAGEGPADLETVKDVHRYFPGAVFWDQFSYPANQSPGFCTPTLFVDFEPDGSVESVTIGGFD